MTAEDVGKEAIYKIVDRVIEANIAYLDTEHPGEDHRPYQEALRDFYARYIADWFDAGNPEPTIEQAATQCNVGWRLDDCSVRAVPSVLP
jgi:hypothetical protein